MRIHSWNHPLGISRPRKAPSSFPSDVAAQSKDPLYDELSCKWVQDATFLQEYLELSSLMTLSRGQWNTDQILSPGVITLLFMAKRHLKSASLIRALTWTQNLKDGQYT